MGVIKVMRLKSEQSRYIITRLFALDYFHYYSKSVLFAAFFLPFIAYGTDRPYNDNEIQLKIQNIKEGKHGIVNNFASQGFGCTPFYQPQISFSYFYNQFCKYDEVKKDYFCAKDGVDWDIESSQMQIGIRKILSSPVLYLKRNKLISESVKKTLLDDLKNGNKFVLAEMLYYIVTEQHTLPNINKEKLEMLKREYSQKMISSLNIHMGFRDLLDEQPQKLLEYFQSANELQIMCFTGTTLFTNGNVSGKNDNFSESFRNLIIENKNLSVEIILAEPDSASNLEASKYRACPSKLWIPKIGLTKISCEAIKSVIDLCSNQNRIHLKVTKVFLPYALFIVKHENIDLDYIKVDLYSPFLVDSKQKPCMYVFRSTSPQLFDHFQDVFKRVWGNDDATKFYS